MNTRLWHFYLGELDKHSQIPEHIKDQIKEAVRPLFESVGTIAGNIELAYLRGKQEDADNENHP